MLQGFKDFLFRGNVIDLAVAVVVGTAFTALVTVTTKSVIEPIINVFGGGSVNGLSFRIISDNAKTTVDVAAVINAFITFAITAAVVYFLVIVPSKKLMSKLETGEAEEPAAPSEEVLLLREIRDALGGSADFRTPDNSGGQPPA